MQLGDLWLKVAKNEQLTPQEQDFIRLEGNNTQLRNAKVSGWTAADGNAKFDFPYAGSPRWTGNPLGTYFITSGTQSLTTAEATFVSFSYNTPSRYFTRNEADATQILVSGSVAFNLSGYLTFAAHSTGVRYASVIGYTSAGSAVETKTLYASAVASPSLTTIPISVGFNLSRNINYFKISVTQTAGESINFTGATLVAFVI